MADLNTIAGILAARLAGATELEKNKIDSLRFGLELILGAIIKGIVLFSLVYLDMLRNALLFRYNT
ncbi:MAG: hypothetical protein K9L17_07200 [Clostridiales bacterium]|nr:hypothetical protein [Clostridiales bacterium]MCF8022458.1 hypothetical protein [Clostridiales bacterium]